MMSARQDVLDWFAAQMAAVLGPSGEFDINPPGEPSRFPCIYVEESEQSADDGTEPGATRYELPLAIDGYVAGGGSAEATAARTALYEDAIAACLDASQWPDCIEEVHEGDMRLATTTLAEERRLGFNLTVTIRFVAPR